MSGPYVTKKKAYSLSSGLLLIGLAALAYLDQWWPGILLAIGISFALRQALLGKWYDACLIALVFGGVFLAYFLAYSVPLTPVILLVAGIYLLFRDVSEQDDQLEEEAEIQKELEEESAIDERK